MSTIKDVAKLAQVSIGTVSNVINGKTQNEVLILKVEKAMEQLAFRPDANARNLKITKSNTIGVILPDISGQDYVNFSETLESVLKGSGYDMYLKLSKNNKMVEKRALERCRELGVAGIIFYSNISKKKEFFDKDVSAPMVVLGRSDVEGLKCDQIVLEYKDAFGKAIRELKNQGIQKVGLVMEKSLLEDGGLENIYKDYYSRQELIKTVDNSKERGFQAFFELYYANPDLEAVVSGGDMIAQGVQKAQSLLNLSDIHHVVVKESNWLEDQGEYEAQLSLSFSKLAKKTAKRLLEAINSPAIHEVISEKVYAQYNRAETTSQGITKTKSALRFAMLDGTSARSLEMLAAVYARESASSVVFDLFSYDELEHMLYEQAERKDSTYDGFMMDISWLDGLVETGYVKNLDEIYQNNRAYFEGFSPNTLRNYCMYVESIYGIPFMSGSQLLFYQKDLFEDQALKIRFRRMYGEELELPKTWAKFNSVAEFFTKKYNSYSPVEYGVSLNQGGNVYTAINYLNHLWSYGGKVFDEGGRTAINSSQAVSALKNFKKSFSYTSSKPKKSWVDIAQDFCEGHSAMVILYNSDAGDINNYTKSKVAGNVGCALIPGGTPVLGGWSLALNTYGRHRGDAVKFLMWACSNENSIPMCLLGGSTLRKNYYETEGFENLEPWKGMVLKSMEQSRCRTFPNIMDDSRYKNDIYTKIIAGEVQRALDDEITEQEAVRNMEQRINEMLN